MTGKSFTTVETYCMEALDSPSQHQQGAEHQTGPTPICLCKAEVCLPAVPTTYSFDSMYSFGNCLTLG